MLYVLINSELAKRLKLDAIRTGNDDCGYIVTYGDLAAYGAEKAVDEGAKLMTNKEAKSWVYNFKNRYKR